MEENNKNIYIIISKTNTVLGNAIQKCLRVDYNHCSISLDDSLNIFYSFGRKQLHNMFRAGFVTESKNYGFFKKYNASKITVLKVSVTPKQWKYIEQNIHHFYMLKDHYKYSMLGLIYCYLGVSKNRKNKYFCSQFVAEILNHSGVNILDKTPSLVRPHDFLNLAKKDIIYQGDIGEYITRSSYSNIL